MFKPRFLVFQKRKGPQEQISQSATPSKKNVGSEIAPEKKEKLSKLYGDIQKKMLDARKHIEANKIGELELGPSRLVLPSIYFDAKEGKNHKKVFEDFMNGYFSSLSAEDKKLLSSTNPSFTHLVPSLNRNISYVCTVKFSNGVSVDYAQQGLDNVWAANLDKKEQMWKGAGRPQKILLSQLKKKMIDACEQYDSNPGGVPQIIAGSTILGQMINDYFSDYYRRMNPSERESLLNRNLSIEHDNNKYSVAFGVNNYSMKHE